MAMKKLLDRSWLMYLARTYRVLIIFLFFSFPALMALPFITIGQGVYSSTVDFNLPLESSLLYGMILSLVISYVLPCLLFRIVNKKNMVDSFFALPVSKKSIAFTSIFFSWLVSFGIYAVIALITGIIGNDPLLVVQYLLLYGIGNAVLLTVNSGLYLIGNQIFDGMVMLGGWTVLPYAFWYVVASFGSYLYAGYEYAVYSLRQYYFELFSTLMTVFNTCSSFAQSEDISVLKYIVVLFLHFALGYFLVKRHFIERKTERAEQLSDNILAYPALIHIYLFLCLIIFSAGAVTSSFSSTLMYYTLLLFIYLTSMFIYRRKIKVSWKALCIYGVGAVVSAGLALTAWNTRFFGLAEKKREFDAPYTIYFYDQNISGADIGADSSSDYADTDIGEIRISLAVPRGQEDEYFASLTVFEKLRMAGVEDFYQKGEIYNGTYAHLDIYPSEEKTEGYTDTPKDLYRYFIAGKLTDEQLILLDQEADVKIYSWTSDRTFTVSEMLDGTMKAELDEFDGW